MTINVLLRATNPVFAVCLAACALAGCGSDDSDADPPGEPAATAIGEARGLPADSEVTIEGVVTVAPGTFNSATGDQGFAVQDESGGVYVSVAELPGEDVTLDARVRVTGRLTQVAQQTVIASDTGSIERLAGMGSVPGVDVATGDVGESTEGSLVRVSGAVTQALVDDSPYGFKVFIDDGSGELQIFVHLIGGEPLADIASIQVEQMVSVLGLAAQYEETYEVMPREASDFAVAQP